VVNFLPKARKLSKSNVIQDELWSFPIKNLIRVQGLQNAGLQDEKDLGSGVIGCLPAPSHPHPHLLLPASFTHHEQVI
jgi:hypothetical protein